MKLKKFTCLDYWFIYIGLLSLFLAFVVYPNREEAISTVAFSHGGVSYSHVTEVYLYGMFRSLLISFIGIGLIVVGLIRVAINKEKYQ